jgi:8-oxo-dGTP pyrophosphatase MutT (NUDIX family)
MKVARVECGGARIPDRRAASEHRSWTIPTTMPITDYLARLAACHHADRSQFVPWSVEGVVVGHLHRAHVASVLQPPTPFAPGPTGLDFVAAGDLAARSEALADLVGRLAARGHVREPLGELYPVAARGSSLPLLTLDRCAVAWFGVPARGVHANGFSRTGGGIELWVARRSPHKRTYPDHLDNLVAGGQPFGLSAQATLYKEAHEEAGLSRELAEAAREVGTLHYEQQDGRTLKPDALVCFDLELPASWQPRAVDGEVAAFERLPLPAVAASLRSPARWKPNCALVVIDFLLRQGALDTELAGDERWRLWRALHGG